MTLNTIIAVVWHPQSFPFAKLVWPEVNTMFSVPLRVVFHLKSPRHKNNAEGGVPIHRSLVGPQRRRKMTSPSYKLCTMGAIPMHKFIEF
jgi:hypothetical protein